MDLGIFNNTTLDLFNTKIMSKLHPHTYVNVYRHLHYLLQHLKKKMKLLK